MRNTREIYQRLREVKYHYLIKFYKRYLKKIPSNCKYNFIYRFSSVDRRQAEIPLCLLHQPELNLDSGIFPNLIEVCKEPQHCISCNAFIFKHTKESIKEAFEEELKNQKIKAEKYPDICALEWVLERSEEIPQPSFFKRLFIGIKSIYPFS